MGSPDSIRTCFRVALAFLFLSAPFLPGCFVKPLEDTPGADGGEPAPEPKPSKQTVAPDGIACGNDPVSGIGLCLGTTACPKAQVDPRVMPGCGFRTLAASFDLECVCNGNMLCPIGVAATCTDIPALFARRTLADVCAQVAAGNCAELDTRAPSDTPPSTGEFPDDANSACKACRTECAGLPTCLVACGC